MTPLMVAGFGVEKEGTDINQYKANDGSKLWAGSATLLERRFRSQMKCPVSEPILSPSLAQARFVPDSSRGGKILSVKETAAVR